MMELRCIGMRIAGFRKLRDMTQEDLAEKICISKGYLSHIESASAGKAVSLPMLIRIARALDVELALLTDIDGIHKEGFKNFWKEIKDTFAEMKKFNDDLDTMIEQFKSADKFFAKLKNKE